MTEEENHVKAEKIRMEYEKRIEKDVINNPPKPPWLAFPDYDRFDIGWRMGIGEDHLYKLSIYFRIIDDQGFESYKKKYPAPDDWEGWYN
ncbi:hypothetical protein [Marinicella sp. W31]|uniref:hypothetical protein n=1 Tax=Marinicella sp. W31 TaxID=3023713 RepID=UPI0037573274